jgi:hypothetical protein
VDQPLVAECNPDVCYVAVVGAGKKEQISGTKPRGSYTQRFA